MVLLRPPRGATDDQPLKHHLHQVWKTTGRQPQQLADQGERPAELGYLWDWLLEMRLPLTYTELNHWQALTRCELTAWEAEILMAIDRIARS